MSSLESSVRHGSWKVLTDAAITVKLHPGGGRGRVVILGKFRGFSEISSSGSSGHLIPDPEVIKEMGVGVSCLSACFLLNRGDDLGSGAEHHPRAPDPYYLARRRGLEEKHCLNLVPGDGSNLVLEEPLKEIEHTGSE